jgi:hypothetical protein
MIMFTQYSNLMFRLIATIQRTTASLIFDLESLTCDRLGRRPVAFGSTDRPTGRSRPSVSSPKGENFGSHQFDQNTRSTVWRVGSGEVPVRSHYAASLRSAASFEIGRMRQLDRAGWKISASKWTV